MDNATVVAVDDAYRMGLDRDAAALLLLQSDSPPPLRGFEVARAAELCEKAGSTFVAVTEDPHESEALLQARRLAGPAIEALGNGIWEDIAVPRSKIPDLIDKVERISRSHDIPVMTFGHAGDGNLHPRLVVSPERPSMSVNPARRVLLAMSLPANARS